MIEREVKRKKEFRFLASLSFIGIFLYIFFSPQMTNAQEPNVLLIISDDLNSNIGSYMGIDKHTPHLNRLSEEGVRFMRAYSQYPQCGASRASIMSGLYPETNGVLSNYGELGSYKKKTPSLVDHPSLAGIFRENGYFTARVSKIFHMGVPSDIYRGEPGGDDPDSWDYAYNVMAPEIMSSGELELLSPKNNSYGSNFSRMIIPDELEATQADYMAASQAIAILENRAGDKPPNIKYKERIKDDAPFFLAVGFVRPHVPFIAPKKNFDPYPEDEVVLPPINVGENVPAQALFRQNHEVWGMDEFQKRRAISGYMASVQFMDEQVGRLLDALDRLNLRKETIVVFLSDHGYNLGEHDAWSKQSLWEEAIRVPLIISVPGQEKNYGSTTETIVELIDLYPTLVDLAGLSRNESNISLQGESLSKYLRGERQRDDKDAYAYTVTKNGSAGSLRTDRWKYNRWGRETGNGNEELYDNQNDPEEHKNLADDKGYKIILEEMREKFNFVKRKAKNHLK